ncbi:DUF2891 domain-containing protein [Streptomyces armeniacus]|uniref:DUF2891 domain-containing protein n=1 Tax=Streptomyces armeniacus TaxID=83291 RepID=A0A345XQV2_9ACTN|nr:DUF2891 domain-containing protein [Streptomyces armeniacus]AXK34018.1 DUF2891 domain-containing protein [Streptomyces armeniacus]
MRPPQPPAPELAERTGAFAALALANVRREWPNAPAHLFAGPADLRPPRAYHPAFYGAYDWHSAVHMHWLLVRLLRRCPDRLDADAVIAVLDEHLTPDALAAEASYLRAHPTYERPYGWAWLLALTAETARLAAEAPVRGLRAERWTAALAPAACTVAGLLLDWLPKATYPVRHGTHANSAFALGLVLDAVRAPAGHGGELPELPELAGPVAAKLRAWFGADAGASFRWEPSGQDFLSPALCEADAMRRVLPVTNFPGWLTAFLPEPGGADAPFLTPPQVSDPADPQIGHLLGLCLSRAAALRSLAAALPAGDPRVRALGAAAEAHLHAALPATASGDFTTDHWLATFAVLALDGGT